MGFNISQFGGGGVFVPYSGTTLTTVPSGATGDIIDITPSTGDIIRVTRLHTTTGVVEPGITVTITNNGGTTEILTNDNLDEQVPSGDFFIGDISIGNLTSGEFGWDFVDCQRIVVTKVSGSTTQNIQIAYREGKVE